MLSFAKMTLVGFKSFVDATELPIEGGLTGIVGPNGCGKSNLVEGLRWAMGETSAKRMRGEGMDDIIFAGSGARPRRERAEVSLILDNREGDAPAPFNHYDQLVVSRSIERESGTRYRVNGTDVRARDVQTLFADAATGAQSPSIVRQGRIAQMISAKPIERRRFLEEAAGIAGLHARRRDAESKLRAANNNISRLEEILRTHEGQRRSLHHQAKEAARYHELARELRCTEAMVLHLEWLAGEAAVRAAEGALSASADEVQAAAQSSDEAATAQAQAATQLPPLRQAATETAAALEGLEGERRALNREVEQAESNLAAAERRREQLKADQERTAAQREDAAAALSRLAEEAGLSADESESADDTKGAGERLASALEEAARLAGEAEATLAARESEHSERENAHTRARTLSESLSAQCAELESRRAETATAAGSLSSEGKKDGDDDGRHGELKTGETETAAGSLSSSETMTRTVTAAVSSSSLSSSETMTAAGSLSSENQKDFDPEQALETAREEEARARAALEEAQRADTSAARKHGACEHKLAAARAECDALSRTLATSQGELWPSLFDEIKTPPEMERALAAALGDDLLASRRPGAPLFWREDDKNTAALPPLPGAAEPMSGLIDAPAALTRRLSQIGVVNEAAEGERLQPSLAAGQRLVSRAGGLWRWDGFSASDASALPAIRRLRQGQVLRARRLEIEGLEESLTEAAREAETARTLLSERAREAERTRLLLESAWRRLQTHAARAENARRLAEISAQLDDLAARRDEARTAETATADAARDSRTSLETARTAAGEARRRHSEADSERRAWLRAEDERRARAAERERETEEWRRRHEEAERHAATLSERLEESLRERERLAAAPLALERRAASLGEQIGEAEGRRAQAEERLQIAEERHRESGEALRTAESARNTKREEQIRAEGRLSQERERLTALAARADERLACAPGDLFRESGWGADEPLPELEATRARLQKLQTERERMGPVNMRAEHEIRDLESKLDEMRGERDELVAGIERLQRGIQTLNREGRRRLLEAFGEVNENFSSLFGRLFGGGEAALEMVESDDPLEAGLEIMASPPGKRLRSLGLLSGGEQSLTALALLFAVFLTNPAPICVLDEVDAALDDINVHRFCDLLEELSGRARTRFMVITHHRHTMARMDRLFGVTMPERGVSRLVSVDLARAEALRETA
ncbi:MAG: AAA family ATPase [Alphaproteobacteria bacterium]|nr:AAA family ATPase [Alphaproteobacteria bacterium]MDA8003793.1 AAA family ATPase [Alphaproteobacteria bacterium]MDA8005397.1 AAA family ATPase [Alphaproteobacteria bacterium]MDA8013398.1 AAA family ATPase [Alphaproteobacteria bacterium]